MSSILQSLKDLRRDLGDWYDHLGNCDFNLSSTTFRAKRKTKLKTLDVNAQAHMFAVRELPYILDNAIQQIEERDASLTRILKWARAWEWEITCCPEIGFDELLSALADAGFEIESGGE